MATYKQLITAEETSISKGKKMIETHIAKVNSLIEKLAKDLLKRGKEHDKSKLKEPELKLMTSYLDEMKKVEYGSKEWKELSELTKPAREHHYKENRHHPEHFGEKGIRGMNLVDLIELLADWAVASRQNNLGGNIQESIKKNQKRFGYDNQLKQILENTVEEYFN